MSISGCVIVFVLFGIGTGAVGVFLTATPEQRWLVAGAAFICLLALYCYRKWEDGQLIDGLRKAGGALAMAVLIYAGWIAYSIACGVTASCGVASW